MDCCGFALNIAATYIRYTVDLLNIQATGTIVVKFHIRILSFDVPRVFLSFSVDVSFSILRFRSH